MTSPAPQPADGEREVKTLRSTALREWADGRGGIVLVPLTEMTAFCDGWDAARAADPNLGVRDAEVVDSARVVHRCDHQAAAHDRKLLADVFYRQLRRVREAVLAIHTPVPTWTDSTVDTTTGETEQNALYSDDGTLVYAPDHRTHCAACPVDTPWPCPTAQAVAVTP